MKINILSAKQISTKNTNIGNKTKNLATLIKQGYNVPKFVAISTTDANKLFNNPKLQTQTSLQIIKILPATTYAVRSSALIEDGTNQSHAGQFLTKIDIPAHKLAAAIQAVLQQAHEYLQGDLKQFSLLIQEYITPDLAGVTFTRDPQGQRAMIIEYGRCLGEQIVGGKITPKTAITYNTKSSIKTLPSNLQQCKLAQICFAIEFHNQTPQDIEWCIQKEKLYILQTRPITTITQTQYQQFIELEKQLPENQKYYFEKTELSEIAPRPTKLTLDLLNKIYDQDGPVAKVYKKYGITYTQTNFLKIFGNELFVNKELELISLLPSYSYLKNNYGQASFCHNFSKSLTTIKNIYKLNTIPIKDHPQLLKQLQTYLASKPDNKNQSFSELLQMFLDQYQVIFEINLKTGIAFKKAETLLKNEPVSFPQILQTTTLFESIKKLNPPKNLIGNTIDFSDTSPFITTNSHNQKTPDTILIWWNKLAVYKQKIFKQILSQAIKYNQLREYGRWLTVKNINLLRIKLTELANLNKLPTANTIYFTSLKNIIANKINPIDCQAFYHKYQKHNHQIHPHQITSQPLQTTSTLKGISAGIATAPLHTPQSAAANKVTKKYILYTQILSPELTKEFSKINGIVAKNGSLLSHLAIMAREHGIPVVSNINLKKLQLKLGDTITIDGAKGEVKLSSTAA